MRPIDADEFEVIGYTGIPEGYKDSFDEGVRYLAELIDQAPTLHLSVPQNYIFIKEIKAMTWTSKAKESVFSRDVKGNLVVRDAVIMQGKNRNGTWSNFSGAPTKMNPAGGKRTFNLVLPEDIAHELEDDGWKIKTMPSKDDQGDNLYFTEIVLNMDKKIEPDIYLCTERAGRKRKTRLHGDDVGMLDDIRFDRADVNIYPHVHVNGVKGHCNQLVVVQAINDLFDGDYDEYEEVADDQG